MESKASQTKPLIAAVIGVIVVVAVIFLGLSVYHQEGESRSAWLTVGADQASVADRLDINAAVQSIDPVKGELVIRLAFTPKGSLASADGRSAAQDLSIETNSSLKPEIKFKKGQPLSSVDVVVELYNGLYTDYPFDQHQGDLQIYATATTPPATEGDKPVEETIPVSVELFGFVHGFSMQGSASSDTTPTYTEISMEVSRSSSTIVWAVFVMILLWLMTLAVVGVTFYVVTSQRKLEFGSFAWMGAMLFAFVSFRSAAPGVPPLGSLIDFVAFYWAECIVAICLVVMVTVYLTRQPK